MYKSLFISDTHLGSAYNNSEKLFALLENIEAEQLFLVGDIINYSAEKDHPDVVRFIRLIQSRKWKIIYITGNNEDDRLQSSTGSLLFTEKFFPKKNYIYNNGQVLIFLEHGHRFHYEDKINRFLHQGLIYLKHFLSQTRKKKKTGVTQSSSIVLKIQKENTYHRYIKPLAQKVLRHSFKAYISARTKEKGCSTVICGHFHIPEDTMVKGIRYLNCGDWVKSSSYIVENDDGEFVLLEEK